MSQQMPPQGPYGQPVPSQGAPLPQRAQARLVNKVKSGQVLRSRVINQREE